VLFAERVAYLEGRVEEHSKSVDGVREALVSLEARVDARFEAVDRRFETVDRRFDGVERRIDALGQKMGRQFVWTVGVQVTLFVGLLAALLAK
jgi:hypothetical protein